MRRFGLSPILIMLLTAACRGQDRAARAAPPVDPALTAMVDSMLPKLEVLSGLKKLRPIALGEKSRTDLRAYVQKRLAEEMPPQEMAGIRATYVALGLMPDSIDLKKLLLDLYQEQVAGYYDPLARTFYVISGTKLGMLRPVLAHELVHALQDQHSNLDSLISRKRGNDRQSAAQAAIEGHATLVMFAYLASEAAGKLIDPSALPDIGAQMRPALEAQNSQFPVFKGAPRIIRETMVWPYVSGAAFTRALWQARRDQGYPAPIGSLLPQSTEQVMHPADRFLGTRDAPTEIRFTNTAKVIYENTLGELETGILLSVHLGLAVERAAAGWDGDRFQLVLVNGRRLLIWQSVWDDASSADRFANAYKQVALKRRGRAIRIERNVISGREGVLIFDGENGVAVNDIKTLGVRIVE